MNLKCLILSMLALTMLLACGTNGSEKSSISLNSTDEQKFSYMLGVQFGRQAFRLIPNQIGYELEEDYVIQGANDAALAFNDTAIVFQISRDSLGAVSKRFSVIANDRIKQTRPDSATLANQDPSQTRQIADSILKTLPITRAKPGTGKAVKVSESSSDIEKFSYMLGTEFGTQFGSIGMQLQATLSVDAFKVGLSDGAKAYRDSSYKFLLPDDSLRAVGSRFSEKGRAIQQEAQKKAMEEEATLKAKAASYVGDTLPDGTQAKINFAIKVSALKTKIETFESYAGKPLFIFYYSTTCGHCRHATPKVDEFAGKFKADGLTTVAMTSGATPKRNILRFSEELNIKNMDILSDEERLFGELYGDGYVPKFYLVRPDGTYKRYASIEQDISEIEADVKALLKK